MADKLTDAEMALLTDEEREGLLEDEDEDGGEEGDEGGDDADPAAAAAATEVKKAAEEGSGEDDGDEPPAAAPPPVAEPAPAAAPAEPVKTGDGVAAADEAAEPTPAWVLPGDFDARMNAVKTLKAEVAKKLDDGELTGEEFLAELAKLEDQHDELRERKIAANIAIDTAKRDFGAGVESFLGAHPQYEKGSALYTALDAEVRKLQASAANPLNPKLIEKAHAKISADIAKAYGVQQPAAKQQEPTKGAKQKRPEPPPTLGGVPAADIDDAGDGGEFAQLERLMNTDSVTYERELARLSPEARDRFLSM